MKKKFTFLMAVMLLMTFLQTPIGMLGQSKTETTTTYTFTSKSWAATSGGNAANWTSGQDGAGFSNNGIQVTTAATGANGTSPVSFTNVTKIVATYNTNKSKGAGAIEARIGSNTAVSKDWAYSTGDGTSANYTVQWDYNTPQTGNVKITCNTTTNSIYLVSVAITTTSGGGSTPSLSVSPSSIAFGTKVVGSSTDESFTVTYANLTANATVNLTGTNTTGYTIDPTSFSVDASGSGSQTVTVTYAPQSAGTFNGSVTVADATDEVDATVTVTGTAKVAHNITINPSIANGNVTSNKSTAIEGETVTLTVTPNTNYTLSSLTVVGSGDEITVTNNQFTMPDEAVTVSATFVEYHAYVINFESELSSYVDWEFSGLSRNNNSSEAHGGSYYLINYANSAATTTGTITTKNKIAKPGTLKFYVKRTGSNTKTANWKVYTSTDGSSWTQRGSDFDATPSSWTERSIDLSSYTNSYIRIKYEGNNAQYRCIDDISLEYTPVTYAVTLSAVSNGTISASDGTTTITSGSNSFETGKTITLTAEGDATHMFSAWSVTGATVADASSATTTFEMPADAVTVSATFVDSWSFTYNINGNTVTEKYARNNASITLPTTSEYCPEGYSIRGWTETESDVTSPITSATADKDRTFYAIFGMNVYGDFAKVTTGLTTDDWTGQYLIVYGTDSYAFDGGLETLDKTFNNISVTISDNKIARNNTTEAAMFTIASNGENKYSIRSASGYYIGCSGSGSLNQTTVNTTYQHEIAVSWSTAIIKCGSNFLRVNSNNDQKRFRYYSTNSPTVQLYKSEVTLLGSYTRIYTSNEEATGDITIVSPTIIENGGVLNMGSHTLTNATAANLIIEDGGQLICNNSVAATVKKSITASSASKGEGWYTISSPVNNKTAGGKNYETVAGVTNLVPATGKYDLYRFNETKDDSDEDNKRWENYKVHGYDLEMGRGYIYRKNSSDELSFVGNTNVGDITYTLTCSDVPELAGFNLIGNPYPHSIAKGSGKAIYHTNLATNYYVLSNDDTWALCTDGDEIPAKQGILVKAVDKIDLTISDTPYAPAAPGKYKNDNIRFSVKNEKFEDVAYAWFDKGHGLPKIAHRNPDAPMLYIPQNGTNYATAIMSDDIKVFGLSFKAMTMSRYTLRAKANGDYAYLHVIDRLTGEDVDMLLEGEYSFIASPNDNENRFIVKLEYKPDYSESNSDIFAYQSGSEILVSGEGELQIFDVTGRNVMTTTINGAEAINGLSNGVYIFRLVGNDIKTQKIVVR